MNFIFLIFTYLCAAFIFIQPAIDSLKISSSLKREVRFTRFSVVSLNKTIVTVLDSSIKQFYDHQNMFIHTIVHQSISNLKATFIVSKCKSYYIDCVNVVSYTIDDVCSKLNFLTQFNYENESFSKNVLTCPIYGDYNFKNITLNAEKFGSIFSFPTEKWWENFWTVKILLSVEGNTDYYIHTSVYFYFIEFRSRKCQSKI